MRHDSGKGLDGDSPAASRQGLSHPSCAKLGCRQARPVITQESANGYRSCRPPSKSLTGVMHLLTNLVAGRSRARAPRRNARADARANATCDVYMRGLQTGPFHAQIESWANAPCSQARTASRLFYVRTSVRTRDRLLRNSNSCPRLRLVLRRIDLTSCGRWNSHHALLQAVASTLFSAFSPSR